MAAHYFTFNGTNSRNMHVLIADPIEIVRPEERVSHVTVPGRGGELTQVEGDDIYNSYIQTVQLSVYGSEYIQPVESWLRGSGDVTFSCQPGFKQTARVINAVTLKKHSMNIDAWTGDVQFYCDPYKYQTNEGLIEVSESGATVPNTGMLKSYPLLTVEGTGTVSISMGGKTLIITDLVSGSVIDCELGWILQNGVPQIGGWSGEFPELTVGNNTLLFTGTVTAIEVQRRMRYL